MLVPAGEIELEVEIRGASDGPAVLLLYGWPDSGPWRYERVDGPGHLMQLEAPGALNALLLDFLPPPG
jgi:pimeloyl-ACP methyl ester carboxylesterase